MAFIVDAVQAISVTWLPSETSIIVAGSLTYPTSAVTGAPIPVGFQVTNRGEIPLILWGALFATAPTVGSTVDLATAITSKQSTATIAANGIFDLTATANKLQYGPMPAGNLSFFVVAGHVQV